MSNRPGARKTLAGPSRPSIIHIGGNNVKESDLFDPLREWFEGRGFDVYSEVELPYADGRADIIAKLGPSITAIEMKKSLSLDAIGQAIQWKNVCHYIYVAVPKRSHPISKHAWNFLRRDGIGLLSVDMESGYIMVHIPPKMNRPAFYKSVDWHKELRPEHKTWKKSGEKGGGYVTKYKIMMQEVRGFLKHIRETHERMGHEEEGWTSIDEILKHCETYYKQPKPSLSHALREIEHSWCETKKENGKLYFRARLHGNE